MTKFFKDILKVKGKYSLKRILYALFALVVILSWIAQQFFGKNVPEYMFNFFTSILKQVFTDNK